MAKVALIATGGTIASSRTEDDSVKANVSGAALRESLHEPLADIELTVQEFATVGSFAVDLPLVFRLASRINEVLAGDDCDGVVVTHGTDTMEESCYLTHLLRRTDKPIVFTGAQRHASDPDTDGPRNLADAIRLAASPKARGHGAMILFEEEIHAARAVTKMHTSRTDTFRSPGLGKIGMVDLGQVHMLRAPMAGPSHQVEALVEEVDLIKLAMGATSWILDAAVERRRRGVVLEAFGRGNAPPSFVGSIEAATARGIAVIIASRCAEGRTHAVYGGAGGGRELVAAGGLLAGSLSAVKSRLLLSVLLGAGHSPGDLAAIWNEH